jgi:hypothetical protein
MEHQTTMSTTTLTTDNCFEDPKFTAWWDEVDAEVLDTMTPCYVTFDDGPILDSLIERYNEGWPAPNAATEAIIAYEIGQAEIEMGIPSWA